MNGLDAIIRTAFERYGLDPAVGMRVAKIESGFNPKAKNPKSSAGGLFQFIDSTARQYGLADRFDPAQAADAAARLTRDNAAQLKRALGRDPTPGELYLAHQQGSGGALKLLSNPDTPAASLVGTKAIIQNGGRQDMLARDFANLWTSKLSGGSEAPRAPQTASFEPQMAQAPVAEPEMPVQSPDSGLANVLGAAFSSFGAAQKPEKGVTVVPQEPQMARKAPNLANILAGVSQPLLLGRGMA